MSCLQLLLVLGALFPMVGAIGSPTSNRMADRNQFFSSFQTHFDFGNKMWSEQGHGGAMENPERILLSNKPSDMAPFSMQIAKNVQKKSSGRSVRRTETTTTGSDIQVSFLKDIWPGPESSEIYVQATSPSSQDLAFFAANDGSTGYEPWVSDGTADGTRRLIDINIGEGDSNDRSFSDDFYVTSPTNNKTYFRVDGIPNVEQFWMSDGTTEGTELILNVSRILDLDSEDGKERFWFIVITDSSKADTAELISTDFFGSQSRKHSFANPTGVIEFDIDDTASIDDDKKFLLIIQENQTDPESENDKASFWKTTDGESFDLFLDPSTIAGKNCSEIVYVATVPPFGHNNVAFLCYHDDEDNIRQRDFYVVPIDNPSSGQLLLESRVGLRVTTEDVMYYTASFGQQMFRYDTKTREIDEILDIRLERNESIIRGANFPPDRSNNPNKMYYFIEGTNQDAIFSGEKGDLVELYSIDVETLETELVHEWRGVEISGGMLLSDGRTVLVLDNETDVDFWALGYTMEETPELVHNMNVTARDGTFWFTRYQHVSVDTLVFSGYDEEHGDELWSLTYTPRVISDEPTSDEDGTDDSSSDEQPESSASVRPFVFSIPGLLLAFAAWRNL